MPQKSPKKNIIVFDIDSGSIGAAAVACTYDEKGSLIHIRSLYEIRKALYIKDDLLFDDFFKKTKKILQSVAEDIHLNSPGDIEGVFCNVSAPWASSQKRIVQYHKPTPFKVTKALVEKCISKEIESPLSKNMDFASHKDLALIERRTIDLYLNGFPSLQPFGQTTKSLDIHSLTSVMSQTTRQAFAHIIERAFHRRPHFFSNTFFNYRTLRTILPDENNVMVLDVAGELSEIFVVVNDHLQHIASFPVGHASIIRFLAKKMNLPVEKIESLLKLYKQNKLDTQYLQKFQKHMKDAFRVWLREFYNTCDVLAQQGLLPSLICLSTEGYVSIWFEQELLVADELNEHTHSRQNISLVHFHDSLKKFTKHTQDMNHFSDTQLALIAHFVTHIY